jgi:phosphoribosylformylglycinamidine synthase
VTRRIGIITLPGSNCDDDCAWVMGDVLGARVVRIWHQDGNLGDLEAVIVPGGFAHGDYLRAGAIARFSPAIQALGGFASTGRPVLGICNGFQILQEAGLLPGAMLRNASLHYECRDAHLRVERDDTPFTRGLARGAVLTMPVAHNEGHFHADDETLARIEGEGRVVLRYTTADGALSAEANFNGSRNAIAGVTGDRPNVMGLMPHPERAAEEALGGTDGRRFLEALLA